MLLHGGETPNAEESSDNLNSEQSFGGLAKPGGQNGHAYLQNNLRHSPWNVQGGALSALSKFGENARMVPAPVWLQRVHHQSAIMGPPGNQMILNILMGKYDSIYSRVNINVLALCLQLKWLRGQPSLNCCLIKVLVGLYLSWEKCCSSQDRLSMFY